MSEASVTSLNLPSFLGAVRGALLGGGINIENTSADLTAGSNYLVGNLGQPLLFLPPGP